MRLNRNAILAAIHVSFLFGNVDDEYVFGLLNRAGVTVERINTGENLVTGGMCRTNMLYLILSGEANVYKTTDGATMLLSVLGVGEIVGAANMFCDDTTQAVTTVIAKHTLCILSITESTFRELLSENTTLLRNYMHYLTGRIRYLVGKIEVLGATSAQAKLLSHILNNAVGNTFHMPQSMSALASTLGISRATLYRAFDELEVIGAVSRNGKVVTLADNAHKVR